MKNNCMLLTAAWALSGVACGSFSATGGGIPAQALILVIDSQGNPVSGATVWVPADSGEGPGLDSTNGSCDPAPQPVLFASCSGDDGIALLQCADGTTFLFQYAKDGLEGTISGQCGDGNIIQAPLGP